MVTYSSLTIKDVLNQSRILYGNNPSLAFVGEKPLLYNELSVLVNNTSCLLATLGIEKGDRVALLGENSPNWGIAYLSIVSMGAVVVPILPDFSSVEVARILEHSQSKAIFISAKQVAKIALNSKQTSMDVILLNNLELRLPTDDTLDTSIGYSVPKPMLNIDFCSMEIPEPMEEDLAAIIYTSGTTGRPKGVMLTHKNLVSNSLSTLQIQNIKSTDRWVSLLPLSHTYECTIGFILPLMQGASIFYLKKPPTPAVLLPALQEVKPTMLLVVPLIIEKIFRAKILPQLTSSKISAKLYKTVVFRKILHRIAARKLHKTFGGELHFFGIGGAKLSFDVERFLYEGKFPYSIGYGMTEASPLLSGCTPSLVKFRCAGFTLPGQEMKVMNPNPQTGEGEVWVRGANVMEGYYKDADLTREVLTDDGWLRTGDLGVIHANGFLELRGRLKNMIVGPSGENIYPEDIEEVINSHSLVLESLVYEIGGKLEAKVLLNYEALEAKYSNIKVAATSIQNNLHDKAKDIMDDVKSFVNSKVASFSKLNLVIEQAEPFEKTPTHKIKRFIYTKTK